MAGAERLAGIIPTFSRGHAVIGICGAPFKCPPAPSECALLLRRRADRARCPRCLRDLVRDPARPPVPPSPETSAALDREFAERDITLITRPARHRARPARSVAMLDDDSELPVRPVPRRAEASRARRRDRERHDRGWLHTRRLRDAGDALPGVYAVGDVATAGVPKAGVFAEGAARVVAQTIVSQLTRRRAAGPPSRTGHLLHRVRPGPDRQRRHRLPLRPDQNGHVQPAFGRADGTEGALRLQPPRALVRRVKSASSMPRVIDHL